MQSDVTYQVIYNFSTVSISELDNFSFCMIDNYGLCIKDISEYDSKDNCMIIVLKTSSKERVDNTLQVIPMDVALSCTPKVLDQVKKEDNLNVPPV